MNKIEKGIESNMVYLQIKELMENVRKQVSVKINNILSCADLLENWENYYRR